MKLIFAFYLGDGCWMYALTQAAFGGLNNMVIVNLKLLFLPKSSSDPRAQNVNTTEIAHPGKGEGVNAMYSQGQNVIFHTIFISCG